MKNLLLEVRELCGEIEKLPASEQQTKISVMAAAISSKMQRLGFPTVRNPKDVASEIVNGEPMPADYEPT